jgi:hypothetical protein
VRVRNIGDEADSAVIRVRAHGGRLEGDGVLACDLAPFAAVEQRYEFWAEAGRICVVRDGVEGVIAARVVEAVDEAVTPWPAALNVSTMQPGAGRLDGLDRVPPADLLQWRCRAVVPDTHFCDLHHCLSRAREADAVVWFGCRVRCAEAMRVAVLLGYDGPVKLFVDGEAVFHDAAGTSPARPDTAAPEVALAAGDHDLAVALGANQGRAWGVFLRLRRTDPGAEATPVLPEVGL